MGRLIRLLAASLAATVLAILAASTVAAPSMGSARRRADSTYGQEIRFDVAYMVGHPTAWSC